MSLPSVNPVAAGRAPRHPAFIAVPTARKIIAFKGRCGVHNLQRIANVRQVTIAISVSR